MPNFHDGDKLGVIFWLNHETRWQITLLVLIETIEGDHVLKCVLLNSYRLNRFKIYVLYY